MVVDGLTSRGLFLLPARYLEHQESQSPLCCPPRLLQALHSALQGLPHGQGWLGWGPHIPHHRQTPWRLRGGGGLALWFLDVTSPHYTGSPWSPCVCSQS